MSSVAVERILQESAILLGPADEDPGLRAVRTAILLEDALGVRLSDDDMRPEIMSDPVAVRALLIDTASPD